MHLSKFKANKKQSQKMQNILIKIQDLKQFERDIPPMSNC